MLGIAGKGLAGRGFHVVRMNHATVAVTETVDSRTLYNSGMEARITARGFRWSLSGLAMDFPCIFFAGINGR